jgi:predicted small secreted protein
LILVLALVVLGACHNTAHGVKQDTKNAVQKTGHAVEKTGDKIEHEGDKMNDSPPKK